MSDRFGNLMVWVTLALSVALSVATALFGVTMVRRGSDFNSKITHYFICQEMTKAVPVYGYPIAEGSYLRVRLSPAETSASLIGPDCFIVPNVEEIK